MLIKKIKYLMSLILTLAVFSSFAQDGGKYVKLGASTVKVGDKNYLAVQFKNTDGWHTYWKNPGDAGLAIKLKFKKEGQEKTLSPLPWPVPKKYIEQGNMWAYGYSDQYTHFYELEDDLKNSELDVVGEWLVCKDICIPGSDKVKIALDSTLQGKAKTLTNDETILKQSQSLPLSVDESPIQIFLAKGPEDNKLALHYIIENFDPKLFNKKANLVTPYLQTPFDYKHEKLYIDPQNKILYGRTYIDWDGEYEEPVWLLPKDGVFKKPIQAKFLLQYPNNENAKIVKVDFKQFALTEDKNFSNLVKDLNEYKGESTLAATSKKGNNAPKEEAKGILFYILFAFVGGLILNLMPCVLPVISLKLFGLIVHSDEDKKTILKHNLFYSLGVLASFMVLGAVVLFLKLSGEQIGWGFQLQSGSFVFLMLMVTFIMALNMLGLFEFVTPGGKKLGNAQLKKGVFGDFMNGVLATILSTPCSAPFLGAALTFAFTSSTLNTFIIFIAVGLGLSFPFILTGFFPNLIKFLPKPGLWMDKLKKILGLSLLLTSVWLYDVLQNLIDMELNGIYLNTILTMTFFSFYFRQKISKLIVWNVLFFAIPLSMATYLYTSGGLEMSEAVTTKSSLTRANQEWKPWSKEKMAKLKEQKKPVFIDFTAKWCLTCKVNKKLVLNTDSFSKLAKKYDVELLVGDWTRRDEKITKFLREYNIVGVPAYFVQKADGSIHFLGETISIEKIEAKLK